MKKFVLPIVLVATLVFLADLTVTQLNRMKGTEIDDATIKLLKHLEQDFQNAEWDKITVNTYDVCDGNLVLMERDVSIYDNSVGIVSSYGECVLLAYFSNGEFRFRHDCEEYVGLDYILRSIKESVNFLMKRDIEGEVVNRIKVKSRKHNLVLSVMWDGKQPSISVDFDA